MMDGNGLVVNNDFVSPYTSSPTTLPFVLIDLMSYLALYSALVCSNC